MASQPPALRPEQIAAIQQAGHARQMLAASNAATAEESLSAASGGLNDGLNAKQEQIDALIARLDAADIP
jgi:hypothetical protein